MAKTRTLRRAPKEQVPPPPEQHPPPQEPPTSTSTSATPQDYGRTRSRLQILRSVRRTGWWWPGE